MSRRKRRLSLPAAAPQAAPCAPSPQGRPVPPPRLALHPDVGGGIPAGVPPTVEEVRRMFGPAWTLGAGEKERLAMDESLAANGVYTLLQHTFQLGQAAAPQSWATAPCKTWRRTAFCAPASRPWPTT